MKMPNWRRLTCAWPLWLAGCAQWPAQAPLPAPPAAAAAPSWNAPLPAPAGGASARTEDLRLWWARFEDPLLVSLVDAAQQASPTLSAAGHRIAQPQAAQSQPIGGHVDADQWLAKVRFDGGCHGAHGQIGTHMNQSLHLRFVQGFKPLHDLLWGELGHRNRACGLEAMAGHHLKAAGGEELRNDGVSWRPIRREHTNAFGVANGLQAFEHRNRRSDKRNAGQSL